MANSEYRGKTLDTITLMTSLVSMGTQLTGHRMS